MPARSSYEDGERSRSSGSRRLLGARLAVLASASVLAAVWLHRSPSGATERAPRTTRAPSPLALTPPFVAPADGGTRGAGVVPEGTIVNADPAQAPTASEAGELASWYATWVDERVDEEASEEMRSRVAGAFGEHDIAPTRLLLACTSTVCRAQLVFPTLRTMRSLGRLRWEPDSLAIGAPQAAPGGVTLVVYWDRLEHELPFH